MSKNVSMDNRLFDAALAAQKNAHAPYSKFAVGAAILTESDKIYTGCNVENAAYPQGMCAEASAIAAMVSDGGRIISQICIVGKGEELVTPCGGCRQKMREFSTPQTQVFVCGPQGLRQSFLLSELLPYSFGPNNLSELSGEQL